MKPSVDCMPSEQFSHLYREHHSWLYTWLCKKLANNEDAADIAQEAFLRLLKKKYVYDLSQPRALLTTIARNISFDCWQKRQLEQSYYEMLQHAEQYYQPSAEEEQIALQTLFELNQVINSLSPRQQQVFMLYQIQECSYAEIAAQLQISVITAKRDMHYALMACLALMQLEQ